MTYEEVKTKLESALVLDPEVKDWYRLHPNRLEILSSTKDSDSCVEFVYEFGFNPKQSRQSIAPSLSDLPLKGLRVALDPGHLGGEMALVEERYIRMRPNPEKGINKVIEFNEGDLALETALKLKAKLEKLGATVFLTRSQKAQDTLGQNFFSWKEKEIDGVMNQLVSFHSEERLQQKEKIFWDKNLSDSNLFRHTYAFLELKKRAQEINAFNPHLTLSIHYNLGWIYDKEGFNPGTEDDYTLFFVPGAFKKAAPHAEKIIQRSLAHAESRYEFVRLLLTDDLEKSIELTQIAQAVTQKTLKLPHGDHPSYLKALCLKHSSGIYHRNLALLRQVHGPILYCEPFCQDNYKQAIALDERRQEVIDQMVGIYLETILNWKKAQLKALSVDASENSHLNSQESVK